MGRFLVADQDVHLCREIADYLRRTGHRAWLAHDCPGAFELLMDRGFDVLIASGTLPGGSLAGLMRAARRRGAEVVVLAPKAAPIRLPAGGLRLDDLERSLLLQALERTGWVRERAAQLLGISRGTLSRKARRLGITEPASPCS